ncbi:hypothetical protein [Streptomyces lydicus]|uniref:hypothetical protein n=1 Tax=Streptomyces lydicus TaxID=47763 RepID=UPI0013E38348|nr:hypothetical protein [Streptomyces lydicus]
MEELVAQNSAHQQGREQGGLLGLVQDNEFDERAGGVVHGDDMRVEQAAADRRLAGETEPPAGHCLCRRRR